MKHPSPDGSDDFERPFLYRGKFPLAFFFTDSIQLLQR